MKDSYRHNFLHRWMENTDNNIKESERQAQIFKMPDNLRRREVKPPVEPTPPKPKSILKAPKPV
jgi:hypothetical protein